MAANEIPKNADKTLFAEDLVNYVMIRHTDMEDLPSTAECYRDCVYNGFNDAARTAVLYLDNVRGRKSKDDSFVANSQTYMMFEKEIRQKYFPDGFDVNNFFRYCVHAATLAADFYKKGSKEAPSLAVVCIVTAFEDFDVTSGGWGTLNEIAEKYSSVVQSNAIQ